MSGVCTVSTCTCICLVCGGGHDVIICRGTGIVHGIVHCVVDGRIVTLMYIMYHHSVSSYKCDSTTENVKI